MRFEQLCKWFLERKLLNDHPDINYAVLSMLFKLANNPLENTFYIPRYQPKQKKVDKDIDELRKETDLTEEVALFASLLLMICLDYERMGRI